MSMRTLESNLAVLQQFQPEAWSLLRHTYDSPFQIEADQICFLGRRWPLAAEPPELSQAVAVLVYGMGDGTWLRQLRARLDPSTPILVFDSQPELAWACLAEYALGDLIGDSGLQWLIAPPDKLLGDFHQVLFRLQDRLGLVWLENPAIAALGSLLNDAFLRVYRDLAARFEPREPLAGLPELEALYQSLADPMAEAYASYPLSCRAGCSGCCEHNVGFHLCLHPLEWALVHDRLIALPDAQRRRLFARCVRALARQRDFLAELLHFFDAQPGRIDDPAFHRELLGLSERRSQEPCPMLDATGGCEVYAGRPLTCRIFGNSQVAGRLPYTCDLDYERLERVLLDEGADSRLVDSQLWRKRLWQLHRDMPYKQVLNLWLLTHLDLEQRDFAPLRLDYQQFQILVKRPELFERLLGQLNEASAFEAT